MFRCILLNIVKSKPVFDPDLHTELIIKDEIEDSEILHLNKNK